MTERERKRGWEKKSLFHNSGVDLKSSGAQGSSGIAGNVKKRKKTKSLKQNTGAHR